MLIVTSHLYAQLDTIKLTDTSTSFGRKWFNKIYKGISVDSNATSFVPERNDLRFQRYKGRVIRNIIAEQMDFGISINDSVKNFRTRLNNIASHLHKNTTPNNIIKNLFFSKYDTLEPFLLADNERYLRDLSYIRDARFVVLPVGGQKDSVDIFVLTKDVFSLGINVHSLSPTNSQIDVTEDNMAGWGNRITFRSLYESARNNKFGYGAEYLHRNFEGTFVDTYLGYFNANNSITDQKQEDIYYAKLVKPLVNPYVRWIYSLEASLHNTNRMYSPDTSYVNRERYRYYNFDSWIGYNVNAQQLSRFSENKRLRAILSLRFVNQVFQFVPSNFDKKYDFHFADETAVLGSVSVFRQDFFKTRYFVGFGRNEDIPEGINIALTGGYTKIDNRKRPYMGLDFGRYYFTKKDRYVNYLFRIGSFFYRSDFEDVNILGDITYYTELLNLGRGWNQRTSFEVALAKQVNYLLVEPLYLQSSYGLPEFSNGQVGGNFRGTIKVESIYYSPLSIAAFRFAPFVFANSTLFTPVEKAFNQSDLYTSLGGGLRTRNESLIFGTLEFKAFYFPQKNLYNKRFRFEFSSNIKFKYNSTFVRKPDFISLNNF
ncbi:MAG: hypothetical protein NVS3B19_04480 [Ginsengibacter sp.]